MSNTHPDQSRTSQTSQSDTDTHEVSFDPVTESATETLALAVADLDDLEQVDLPVMAEYIDPDALDSLIQPNRGESPAQTNRIVSFRYGKYEARIHSAGRITLDVAEDPDSEWTP